MTPRSEIESRFSNAEARLNTHRRQLVRAILDSPSETFFLSSRQLALRYGVDPATIVRTIQALGYERFADFAADLRQHFVTRLTPYQIMEASSKVKGSAADHVLQLVNRATSPPPAFQDVKQKIIARLQADYTEKQVREHTDSIRNLPIDATPALVASLRTRYQGGEQAPAQADDGTIPTAKN